LGTGSVQRGAARVALGLVGVGRWGRRIIATIDCLPDAELVAICSQTRPPLGDRAIPWFARWEDLIASGQCDGIVVASPPETHVPIALGALGAGLAVMIEKPLALSLNDATHLSDYAASLTPCPPMLLDHTHLFAPAYQKLKSSIRSPILEIRTRGCSFEPWRPYSSLFDFGPHDLSMVLDLMGSLPERSACRVVSEITRETTNGPKLHQLFRIEMTFGSARATCIVGNASPNKARYLEVVCENGDRLVYDDTQEEAKLRINDSVVNTAKSRSLTMAMIVFTDAALGIEDRRCGLSLGVRIQTVLETCTEMMQRYDVERLA
jgi:predicted dehydrogenase